MDYRASSPTGARVYPHDEQPMAASCQSSSFPELRISLTINDAITVPIDVRETEIPPFVAGVVALKAPQSIYVDGQTMSGLFGGGFPAVSETPDEGLGA